MPKTIVFCEDSKHALAMVRILENENSDLVSKDPRYVMRITGNDDEGLEDVELCSYRKLAEERTR